MQSAILLQDGTAKKWFNKCSGFIIYFIKTQNHEKPNSI